MKAQSRQRFKVHHTGCYSCIPTEVGAKILDKDGSTCNGITFNEYAVQFQETHGFSMNERDVTLMKSLMSDTLFCKHCYRPFAPQNKYNMDEVLLSPFWALTEILSIYLFYLIMLPLATVYGVLKLLGSLRSLLVDWQVEAPTTQAIGNQLFEEETLKYTFL